MSLIEPYTPSLVLGWHFSLTQFSWISVVSLPSLLQVLHAYNIKSVSLPFSTSQPEHLGYNTTSKPTPSLLSFSRSNVTLTT